MKKILIMSIALCLGVYAMSQPYQSLADCSRIVVGDPDYECCVDGARSSCKDKYPFTCQCVSTTPYSEGLTDDYEDVGSCTDACCDEDGGNDNDLCVRLTVSPMSEGPHVDICTVPSDDVVDDCTPPQPCTIVSSPGGWTVEYDYHDAYETYVEDSVLKWYGPFSDTTYCHEHYYGGTQSCGTGTWDPECPANCVGTQQRCGTASGPPYEPSDCNW